MGNKKSRDSRERRSEADQPNAETHLSQNEITIIWSHWESLKPHKLKLAKKILKVYLKEHPKARELFPPHWKGISMADLVKLHSFRRKANDTWEAFTRVWECIDDPKLCQRVCFTFGKKHVEWNARLRQTRGQIDEHHLKNFMHCFSKTVLDNSRAGSSEAWRKATDYFSLHFLRGLYDSPDGSLRGGVEEDERRFTALGLPKIASDIMQNVRRRKSKVSNSESCSPQ